MKSYDIFILKCLKILEITYHTAIISINFRQLENDSKSLNTYNNSAVDTRNKYVTDTYMNGGSPGDTTVTVPSSVDDVKEPSLYEEIQDIDPVYNNQEVMESEQNPQSCDENPYYNNQNLHYVNGHNQEHVYEAPFEEGA